MSSENQTAEQQSDALRERVRDEMARSGLSQSQASKEAGVDTSGGSRLNQWLQGKYAGDNSKIEQQVLRWLESRQTSSEQYDQMPTAPAFVATETAGKIFNTLDYARRAAVSVCVYGGAGVGKTEACKAFAEQHPNVFIVTASPAASTYATCLRRIAAAVTLRSDSTRSMDLEDGVIARLKGTNGLLILDEAQALSTEALWGVKHIFDTAKIGIAYVGSTQLYCNLSGRRTEMNAPLFRRISKKQALNQPTLTDVKRLLTAWGLLTIDNADGRALTDYCAKIAAKPGALGVLTETLRYASTLAVGMDSVVNLATIQLAYQDLGGE